MNMAASVISKGDLAKTMSLFRRLAVITTANRSPAIISQSLFDVRARELSTSSLNFVKRIEETTTGNVTVIEGVICESEKKAGLIPLENHTGCCTLCRLNLKLRHTDVLIISQFVRPDGCMLSRRVTGLCGLQQKIVSCLVAQAQKAGLMSNLNPHWSNKDPTKRYGYKKFNRYFEPGPDGNVARRYS